MKFIEKIVNDRYLKYLLGLSGYFFLTILILNSSGRDSNISQYLFLTTIAILVARVIYIVLKRDSNKEPGKFTPVMGIINNATVSIGYFALIAIVLGNGFGHIWLIYTPIAVIFIMAVAALVFHKVKPCSGKV